MSRPRFVTVCCGRPLSARVESSRIKPVFPGIGLGGITLDWHFLAGIFPIML
jgi:hypothetical protein